LTDEQLAKRVFSPAVRKQLKEALEALEKRRNVRGNQRNPDHEGITAESLRASSRPFSAACM